MEDFLSPLRKSASLPTSAPSPRSFRTCSTDSQAFRPQVAKCFFWMVFWSDFSGDFFCDVGGFFPNKKHFGASYGSKSTVGSAGKLQPSIFPSGFAPERPKVPSFSSKNWGFQTALQARVTSTLRGEPPKILRQLGGCVPPIKSMFGAPFFFRFLRLWGLLEAT